MAGVASGDRHLASALAALWLIFAFTAHAGQTEPKGLRHAVMGDGLVTVASAWGEHRNPARALQLPASRKRLITQASHWDLLSHPQVADALRDWLR